jgi:phosphopantothenoylcysteine synthetase/decarboxylase
MKTVRMLDYNDLTMEVKRSELEKIMKKKPRITLELLLNEIDDIQEKRHRKMEEELYDFTMGGG